MPLIASPSKEPAARQSMGLSGITGQVFRKVTKKGFDFCLMVAGESGLGKTTLVNSLFMTTDEPSTASPRGTSPVPEGSANVGHHHTRRSAAERLSSPTVQINPTTRVITESGLQLKLTIVDTPGFADGVDNTKSWQPLLEYIERAYNNYLLDELKADRAHITDTRVHCLLYFINPNSHGLRPIDIETMLALHERVNIIPLIAKADTLTRADLAALKAAIKNDIEEHDIQVFIPAMDQDDEDSMRMHQMVTDTMPFAVVGSNKVIEVGGKQMRARVYPWGMVEVENPEHCDFKLLRDMLVRTHLQDLKDVTTEVLYENFRKDALSKMKDPGAHVMSAIAADESNAQAQQKEIIESEAELLRKHEEMKRALAEQKRALELQRKQLEEERRKFEEAQSKLKNSMGEVV